MNFFTKKINFILFITIFLFPNTSIYAKDGNQKYSKSNISNYFSGLIYMNQANNDAAFKHFKKIQFLKEKHSNYNIQFARTLVLLDKFDQAYLFLDETWNEDEYFFESDLLLGLESFLNEDFSKAKKHFKRINNSSNYDFYFEDFLGNMMLAWIASVQKDEKGAENILKNIPERYKNLTNVQSIFIKCYFNNSETENDFKNLILENDLNFSRYNFFLANYLLFHNKEEEAKKIIYNARKKYSSNLLIKETKNFLEKGKIRKIKNFFDCRNPKDSIAEIFYVIANFYSTQEDYRLSNFFLRISLYLNSKFSPNKTLLAENFFYQEKYDSSKKIYDSIKSIGTAYSWYASLSNAIILSDIKEKNNSITNLEKNFNSLPDPTYEHYYELANFYKDNKFFKKSIKYYILALEKIDQDNILVSKIYNRIGTSYERLGEWKKAETNLMESLKILPDQAHTLNYLAYMWVEKKKNIEEALQMLEKAVKLKKNDGYIIDSLGWAHYMNKNYQDAEKYLQKAVELMPLDPVINDHYADALWMLEKRMQARYIWSHVLSFKTTEEKLKEDVNKKIIFGVSKKL